MEPQIRYVRTADGINIAYATVGDGPPVLHCAAQQLSMRQILDDTRPLAWHLALSAHTRLTVFDNAGIGASQREVSDFSLGAQLRTIEAVAERLADDRFTLCSLGAGGVGAALYASKHPDRVRELACLYPAPSILTERFAETMRQDWSLARRRLGGWAYPDDLATQRWFGKALGESATANVAAAYCEEFARAEIGEIYRRIPVPTLFCVTPEGQDREDAIALASLVPDCRVVTVNASEPGHGIAAAVLELMGVGTPSDATHGTAIILFADIADSTALTERLGDAAFREKARALDDALRIAVRDTGGAVITANSLGDGILATFPAAAQAITAALACSAAGDTHALPLHVGLHAGDVIREADNVFGGAVNIAARISALSAPGEVLVSDIVRGLARTSAGVGFEDRGEHALKGIAEPQRVFAVRASESG